MGEALGQSPTPRDTAVWGDASGVSPTPRDTAVWGDASGVSPTQGMPLGNLTSQFFANIYLNELDYFVKHTLRAKHYIRYVDDFVIFHISAEQLETWKEKINLFLKEKLDIQLHPDKSRVISLSRGVDFVGFRNFYYYKLLRKRNIRKMRARIEHYKDRMLTRKEIMASFQGWNAYAKGGNTLKLRRRVAGEIAKEHEEQASRSQVRNRGDKKEMFINVMHVTNAW